MWKWFLSLFSRRAPQPVLAVIHDKEEDSSNHVIREEDDLVLDLPQEAKLGNYKRAKPPARSRPTVRPTAPVNQEKPGDSFKEDEGIDQFFGSTSVPVSAAGSPSPIANKKTPIANPSKSADTKKKSPWPNFNPFGNKEKTEKKRSKLSSRKASETEEEKKKDDKQDNKRGSKPTPPAASAKPKVTNSSQESRKEESVERRPKEFEEVEEEKFEKKEEVLEEIKKTVSSVEVKLPQVLEKNANALEKEPGEITKIDGDKMDETKKEQEQPDKEKTEEVAPKVPLVVPKRPGLPGMGFGANILAQVKAEQEKRKSMIPNTNISIPVKSPASEKEVPLFPRNLKPVNERATVSPQSDERLTQEDGNKKSIGDGGPKSPLNKIRVPQSDERLTQENGSKKSIGDGRPKSPLNKLRVSDKSVPTSTKPLDSVQDIMTKSAEIPKIESCPVKEEKKTIATDDDIEKIKDAPSSKIDIIPPGSQKDSDGSNADSHGKSDQKPPPALRPRPQIKTTKPRSLVEAEVKPNEKEHEKEKEKQKHTEEKPNKKEHEEKQKHPEEKPNEKESEEKQKHPEEKQNKKEHEEKQKHPEENPNKKEHEEKQKHPEEKQIKKEHEEKQKHPEGKPNEKEKEEKQKHQESGVVYDSATIRLSLKEKMALFGEQNAEDKHQKPEKSNSLPRGVKPPEQIDEKRPNSMILPTLVKRDIKKNSKKSEEIKVEVKEGKNSASDDDVSSESDSETFKIKSGLRSSASSPDSAECPNRDSSSSEEVIMV